MEKSLDELDSSKSARNCESRSIPPKLRRLHDPDVSFQEYQHYARLTRKEQEDAPVSKTGRNILAYLIPNLQRTDADVVHTTKVNLSDRGQRATISDEEWVNASRAMRLASTSAVFYLITTDIFGPFGLPYAFATTGWG